MKLPQIFLYFFIITNTFLLTNCYVPPESILKLEPQSDNNEWYKGKEIVTIDNDSLRLRISFDRTQNKDYLFDIDIENISQKNILVEPEKFSYKMKKGSIKYKDTLKSVYAKDPEKVILELQKANSIHQSNMETQAMIYSLGYFLQFAGQTKALVTGDTELSERVYDQTRKTKENELIDDISNNRISKSLDNSSYVWEILALRKTTLYPDESISGKVFFPVSELAKTLEFSFPVDQYELKLFYNQEVISAKEKSNYQNAGY
jgi:hypothetical protein